MYVFTNYNGSLVVSFSMTYVAWLGVYHYRIFVNRSMSMDRIKYIGFDMDHTLVGE